MLRDTTMLPPPPPPTGPRYMVVSNGRGWEPGYLMHGKRQEGDIPTWSVYMIKAYVFDDRETAAQALRWVREHLPREYKTWIEER